MQGADGSFTTDLTQIAYASQGSQPATIFTLTGHDSRGNQTVGIDGKGNSVVAIFDGASRAIESQQLQRYNGLGNQGPAGNSTYRPTVHIMKGAPGALDPLQIVLTYEQVVVGRWRNTGKLRTKITSLPGCRELVVKSQKQKWYEAARDVSVDIVVKARVDENDLAKLLGLLGPVTDAFESEALSISLEMADQIVDATVKPDANLQLKVIPNIAPWMLTSPQKRTRLISRKIITVPP